MPPHLLEALRHKVLEAEAPALLVGQARGWVLDNHENNAVGVDAPARRELLRHLDCAHAQCPDVDLQVGHKLAVGGQQPNAALPFSAAPCRRTATPGSPLQRTRKDMGGRLGGSIRAHWWNGPFMYPAPCPPPLPPHPPTHTHTHHHHHHPPTYTSTHTWRHPVRRSDERVALAHRVGQLCRHAKVC